MADNRVRITYQDYLQLPEDSRYEVLAGDLRMVPAPDPFHQIVLSTLNDLLKSHVQRIGLGRVLFAPVDVILDVDTVVQPDLLVVLADHVAMIQHNGVHGAPVLVVEVLSPGTATRDRGIKRRLYGRYGVREYWLVDPQERTVEVTVQRSGAMETYSLVHAGGRVESPLLSGLEFAVDNLFAQ